MSTNPQSPQCGLHQPLIVNLSDTSVLGDRDECLVEVTVAVTSVKTSHKLSLPVIQSAVDSAMGFTADDTDSQVKSLKISPFSGFLSNGDKKRAKGFEPSTYSLGSCHSTN